MAHTSWSVTASSKKVVEKLKENIAKTFAGSGDPEVYDCPHVIDVLQRKFPGDFQLKHQLQALLNQTKQIDPCWLPPAVQTVVPATPLPMQVGEGWLLIWSFGHSEDSAIKGKSNMVNIWEVAFSFLENTFNSAQNPVEVLFTGQPGEPLADFSVRLSLGFTRVLAAYVVLLAMLDLEQAELAEVVPVLRSLFALRYTYNPATSDAAQRARSLAAKFQVSESTRPDCLQIFHTLSEGLKRDGADVATGLAGCIDDYNALSSVQSQNISGLEKQVICALPHQTARFRSLLSYHWQNFKSAESGVPMKVFTHINSDVPPEATGVWKDIMSSSAEKNELFIDYLIGVFVKNFKSQLRLKKKPSLRFIAGKLRVSDPNAAYRQCCLWAHFRPQMRSEMSAEEFQDLERSFCRGAFDKELIDRVRAMNPTLKLEDFRFFYLHLGRDQPLKEEGKLNAQQEEAEAQQEQARLCCLFILSFYFAILLCSASMSRLPTDTSIVSLFPCFTVPFCHSTVSLFPCSAFFYIGELGSLAGIPACLQGKA